MADGGAPPEGADTTTWSGPWPGEGQAANTETQDGGMDMSQVPSGTAPGPGEGPTTSRGANHREWRRRKTQRTRSEKEQLQEQRAPRNDNRFDHTTAAVTVTPPEARWDITVVGAGVSNQL